MSGTTLLAALLIGVGSIDAQEAPFAVQSASLSQEGRRLVWSVALSHPFSGAALRRAGRSLCLLIEGRRGKLSPSRLCVAPPAAKGRPLRLSLAHVRSNGSLAPPRMIAATVMRTSTGALRASFTPASVGLGYSSLRWQVRSRLDSVGCEPKEAGGALGAGSPAPEGICESVYPSTPALSRLHAPKLVGCVASGKTLVFGGSSKKREIALTFDDGPWGDPPSIDFVDLLARYHAHATFFEIGDQIGAYDRSGAVERRMLADGDTIGDHTWTHPDMVTLAPARQRSELELTADAIRRASGFTPCLWRPPYGDSSDPLDTLANSLGFLTISWDIDPRDWSLPGVGKIESAVLDNARNGGIVEMHFGGGPRQQTLSALPDIITTLRKRGYRFVNLAAMLGLRLIYK